MSGVHLTVKGAVAELHLDNPTKLNALTVSMLEQIEAHCNSIESRSGIAALIVTAEGDRAFCVGADINAWADLSAVELSRHWVRNGHRIFDRLTQLAVPTIAAINGLALGGGLELAAACDLRVMVPAAKIGLPESSVGIVPGWSGSQRLSRHMPPAILKEMILLGNRIDAERAFQVGFINEISEDVNARARDIADRIAQNSPRANEISKYMLLSALQENSAAHIEALGSGMIAYSNDKKEGVASFREKRVARFTGE